MRILVVGCGNVGSSLVERLCAEGHNVVVIDQKSERLKEITERYDVMGVQGNGASYAVQMEAGIEETDLLIAVTNEDELNLFCCLIAKKAGGCHTIARVRNPVYSQEINFIKDELGLSMIINPEQATAAAIARLLKFPSAIEVDTFSKGRVELSRFRLPENCVLDGCQLRDISGRLHCDVLVCIVERGDQVCIPDGNFRLQAKDKVSVVASQENIVRFYKQMGLATNQVRNAMIVGGGSTTFYLAKQLLAMGIQIKIIERDEKRCEELCEILPQATILHGDGTDRNVLLEEGVANMQAFVSMTGLDEENIMLSLFVKTVSKAKLVTRIHRVNYDDLIDTLDVGSVIYPRFTTAETIVRYVRAMSNSQGSNMETLYQLFGNKAEALEFRIREHSPVVGIPLQELSLKPNLLIGCINHNGKITIPGGQSRIHVGDTVIVVTTNPGLHDIKDIVR
ncbi:MAG: Trk system potassium transporter TrkA [Lachnospiraceae bacterium]|nr:Trk system potassium transporter TrkA [Lachnospiraceae bacterium]